jgi:uncharacterized protein YecE (DUF72 family)
MIYVGTAAWSIPRAVAESFAGTGSHLERYARVFAGTEINSSFYKSHSRQTYARWAAGTPSAFRFAVKLPQTITHEARLRRTDKLLDDFLAEARGLGRKLGPLLIQLPGSFTYDRRVVRRFLALLREKHRGAVVCEPRHASWFTPQADAVLREFRIGRVAADPAKPPEAALPGAWPAVAYYRLHGSPRMYWSVYERPQLETWAAQLRALPRRTQVWCVFDNTASGGAAPNALEMQALLE